MSGSDLRRPWRIVHALVGTGGASLLALLPGPGPLGAQEVAPVVRSLKFEGNRSIDSYTLSIAISTTNSSWFARTPPFRWLGLGEKRQFGEQEFRRDVLRLTLLYRQSGFLEVGVDTVVQRGPRDVHVKFIIHEGEPVRVTSFTVTGLDSLRFAQQAMAELPLRVGAPFNRFLFQASADTILRRLRDRGYPSAEVLRNLAVDKVARSAVLSLDVILGTPGWIGSITVEGAQRVDTAYIRQLLAVRTRQYYSQSDLFESQRKLYQTELFRFATVGIDSANFAPDDSIVPIVVRVSEGKPHRIRSSLGYATNDCFRTSLGWTDRNLFRSGRLFDISGRLSKIGVGQPFGFGLENSICQALKADVIGSSKANFSVTALVRQPRVFGSPRNVGTYTLFGERRSEFKVYRRDEVGSSWSITRETPRRVPVTGTYQLSYGKTIASAATYCAFFNACTPADTARLGENRRAATLSASVSWPRANRVIDPTEGSVTTVEVAHSSRYVGSSSFQQFTRFAADAAWYRQLGRSVVLSWHLHGGFIVSPKVAFDSASINFTPPEQRFYAGGPNDVRGFDRNELGPLVYVVQRDTLTQAVSDSIQAGQIPVRFSATGGNMLGVGNVELRVPSPVFRQRLRLALFVDGGILYERGKTNLSPAVLRITPGVGLRIGTPLGPVRLDLAYNGYAQTPGALYLSRSDGELRLVQNDFVRPRRSHYNIHFAVGQPF